MKLFNRQIQSLRFNLIQFDFIRATSGTNWTTAAILGVSNDHYTAKRIAVKAERHSSFNLLPTSELVGEHPEMKHRVRTSFFSPRAMFPNGCVYMLLLILQKPASPADSFLSNI